MIELSSMAVVMPEVKGHPNRTAFRGVLTVVDAPSQRSPSGAKGHLVVLTRVAAETALPSLLGMALDYAPTLDRHDVRRKVGVITRAEIVARKLEIGGYLFAKDFPEIVEEVARSGERSPDARTARPDPGDHPTGCKLLRLAAELRAEGIMPNAPSWPRRIPIPTAVGRGIALKAWNPGPGQNTRRNLSTASAPLGMSYEVTQVQLADTRARVWILTKVTFTGAAILRRDKAAYQDTWIELED